MTDLILSLVIIILLIVALREFEMYYTLKNQTHDKKKDQ